MHNETRNKTIISIQKKNTEEEEMILSDSCEKEEEKDEEEEEEEGEKLEEDNNNSNNSRPQSKHRRWWEKQLHLRLQGNHSPRYVAGSTTNDSTGKKRDLRKKCKLCGRKISSKCFECGVFLCFGNEEEQGCWDIFHKCEEFPKSS